MNNKEELRKKYLKIRKEIENKEIRDSGIFQRITELPEYKESKLILTYVSLEDEVDTIKLIEYSLQRGKQVAVPKCEGSSINFYYINSIEELKEGCFKVKEPQNSNRVINFDNSICIIPGVSFDKQKNRIGYGKGYYDRFFQKYEGVKIGLTYNECICDKLDVNEYDKKVDQVIYC